MGASLLAVLVVSVLLAAVARRYDVSAPLALVVAGLAAGMIPGSTDIELDPELEGISASVIATASAAVLATVIVVRIVWVYLFAYLPRLLSSRIREREPAPTPAQVFVVAWAGMRGVVSLAAAFGVPMTTLSGEPFPGRPQLVFLTFVVVIGTLLLHGLKLPWLIRRLGVHGDEASSDAIAAAAAQDKAARAAADRLDELLAEQDATDVHERAADVLRGWNTRRRNSAWERLGRDDEVLRAVLHGLDLEEATLNRV